LIETDDTSAIFKSADPRSKFKAAKAKAEKVGVENLSDEDVDGLTPAGQSLEVTKHFSQHLLPPHDLASITMVPTPPLDGNPMSFHGPPSPGGRDVKRSQPFDGT